MKRDLKKPCKECPFSRKSCKGWTGGSHPRSFIHSAMGDGLMECHMTVEYDDPDLSVLEQLMCGENVQQCAGVAIFRSNNCKIPRNRRALDLPPDKEAVFSNPQEFLDHHASAWERVFED